MLKTISRVKFEKHYFSILFIQCHFLGFPQTKLFNMNLQLFSKKTPFLSYNISSKAQSTLSQHQTKVSCLPPFFWLQKLFVGFPFSIFFHCLNYFRFSSPTLSIILQYLYITGIRKKL